MELLIVGIGILITAACSVVYRLLKSRWPAIHTLLLLFLAASAVLSCFEGQISAGVGLLIIAFFVALGRFLNRTWPAAYTCLLVLVVLAVLRFDEKEYWIFSQFTPCNLDLNLETYAQRWELGALVSSLLLVSIYWFDQMMNRDDFLSTSSGKYYYALLNVALLSSLISLFVACLWIKQLPHHLFAALAIALCFLGADVFTLKGLDVSKAKVPARHATTSQFILFADIPVLVSFIVLGMFLIVHHFQHSGFPFDDESYHYFLPGAIAFQFLASNTIFLLIVWKSTSGLYRRPFPFRKLRDYRRRRRLKKMTQALVEYLGSKLMDDIRSGQTQSIEYFANKLIDDIRSDNILPADLCRAAAVFPNPIDSIRKLVKPSDWPHLRLVCDSTIDQVAFLGISLLNKIQDLPDVRKYLEEAWRRPNSPYETRLAVQWTLLNYADLDSALHEQLFEFTRTNWERWLESAEAYVGGRPAIIAYCKQRLNDSSFPRSKDWAYLCVAAASDNVNQARQLIEERRNTDGVFLKTVAEYVLARL